VALLLACAAAGHPALSAEPRELAQLQEQQQAILRLRVYSAAAGRDWLAAEGFDVAGRDRAAGWVEVITDAAGARRLRERGFRLELIEPRGGPRPPAQEGPRSSNCDEINNIYCYTNPAELEAFLQQTAQDHPAITRLVALGTSVQGRTIWGLMISDNAAQDEDELAILFNGAHHAREVMTPEIVMDIIDHLTDNYGTDPDLTAKVDAYQIWCVPMVNPDGVNIVHTLDDFWRKNARDNDSNGTLNSNDGVDLNRNYDWGWGNQCLGSSGSFSSQSYRGPQEGSEPETEAMIALGRRIQPVFDVEYHSYGEDVFYAMSCDPQDFNPELDTVTGPDTYISRVTAEDFAARIVQADGGIGYNAAPFGDRVDGVGRDHQYHENGTIAFVTEVNSSAEGGFHPDYNLYRDPTVEGQRPGWVWLIDRIQGPAIGGHVLDVVTGLPVEADLSLDELHLPDGKRLTSRADTGRFHIIVVPDDYTLRVRAPGYQDASVPVTVGASWSPMTVLLQPSGSSLLASDDLEDPLTPTRWSVGAPGDTAISGLWVWGDPQGTHSGDAWLNNNLQFGNARFDRTSGEGRSAFVTGNAPGGSITADEVSGGTTTLLSPSYDVSGRYAVEVSWQRWFRNDPADAGDQLRAEVSANGGASWQLLETLSQTTTTPDASPAWAETRVRLDDLVAPGPDVRFRFRANDSGVNHIVEAAIDDLVIRGYDMATQGQIAGVRLAGGAATVVQWQPLTGAPDAVYDVARGDLSNLASVPQGVDLGPLVCIEDNSPDTSTSGNVDTAVPPAGSGFFYVVRFNLGHTLGEWGRGSAGGLRQGTGGCAP
jgi:hypothetical protein